MAKKKAKAPKAANRGGGKKKAPKAGKGKSSAS